MYRLKITLLAFFASCVGCSNNFESRDAKQIGWGKVSQAESFNSVLEKLDIPEVYRLEDLVIGEKSAPVMVLVYTSFSCGYCRDFWIEVFPEVYEKYIKTGKVKIIARNYLEDNATLEAAMLTRCAVGAISDANLKIMKKIYQRQEEWLSSKNPQQFLKNLFREIFRYGDEFWANSCLADAKLSAGIMLFQKDAFSKFGLKSVPSFVIIKNGKVLVTHEGRLSFETIDLYLSEAAKIS